MPLSEYEQRVLEQMERQLSSDDPKLVSTFHGQAPRSLRRWVLVGVGVSAGLTVLVVGAATSQAWVGVLGFLLMFGSVAYAFSPQRGSGPVGVVQSDGKVRPAERRRPVVKGTRGFMARLEERWDRRRESGGR